MTDQFPDLRTSVREMPAEELLARLDGGVQVTVLDTRRPEDYEAWRLTHPNLTTVNVPFTAFLTEDGEPAGEVPEGVPDGPLVTSCAKGISSLYVAEFLAQRGWDVEALDDGMRGWARLYEAREVASGGPTTVLQYHRPSSGCLAYLVVSGDEAAVLDPLGRSRRATRRTPGRTGPRSTTPSTRTSTPTTSAASGTSPPSPARSRCCRPAPRAAG